MKKLILKVLAVATLTSGAVSCGNDFLDTKYYQGIDVETALNNVPNIGTALNGTYYRFFHYYFAGNYATMIGDVASDIAYWNMDKGHFNNIYLYTFQDTDSYLYYIWNYGYKVADNAARIIKAAAELEDLTSDEQAQLNLYVAEAHALRGYATFVMTNIFGHQIKVNGTDYSSQPGIVLVDKPIAAFENISRASVGECYAAALEDFNQALSYFSQAGGDRDELTYFNTASVYGMIARINLYMENWSAAATAAQNALNVYSISELAYTNAEYSALYTRSFANWESLFALGIDDVNNWSANSCGTLWSTYGYSPTPKLQAMFGDNDVRTSIWKFSTAPDATVPYFTGGKFGLANPANSTNYLVNAPEMFLIIAEANLRNPSGSLTDAKEALMTVAQRNPDITEDDLGSTKDEVFAFLKDERARELFQEGHRFYDLRRWDEAADICAINAPEIAFRYTNFKISNVVFPIPIDEINAGFGVEQTNDWANALPK